MTVIRLPRTIRLDDFDAQIFERAAAPGEWAVAGGFAFIDVDPAQLVGKRRQAFAAGFLGTESFGWSTLAIVASADEAVVESMVEALAGLFVEACGAPSIDEARPVARQEVVFMRDLCAAHGIGTLLAVNRVVDADGGIRERFQVIDPGGNGPGKAFEMAPDEGGAA